MHFIWRAMQFWKEVWCKMENGKFTIFHKHPVRKGPTSSQSIMETLSASETSWKYEADWGRMPPTSTSSMESRLRSFGSVASQPRHLEAEAHVHEKCKAESGQSAKYLQTNKISWVERGKTRTTKRWPWTISLRRWNMYSLMFWPLCWVPPRHHM